jgi:hypothetical protein
LPHSRRNGDAYNCASGVYLYWYWDGTGVAVETDYWGVEMDKPEEERTYVRYYAFELCQHKYKEMSHAWCKKNGVYHAGMCWHVERCSKCGHIKAYDSSD